jgi:hypothetical protein
MSLKKNLCTPKFKSIIQKIPAAADAEAAEAAK